MQKAQAMDRGRLLLSTSRFWKWLGEKTELGKLGKLGKLGELGELGDLEDLEDLEDDLCIISPPRPSQERPFFTFPSVQHTTVSIDLELDRIHS